MESAAKRFKPTTGYVVLQAVEPGKTAGGLHVPATSKYSRLVVVEASEGHWHHGGWIPCPLHPGAEVIVNPDWQQFRNVDMPKDHLVTELRFIAAYEAPTVKA